MEQTVRIGMIGAGQMARRHLGVLRAIPGMKVVGIASRTLTKAQSLAQEFEIPGCHSTWQAMVEHNKPHALMVLVSADQVLEVASALMPLRVPLFLEKPAGLFPEQARKLLDFAQQ